MKAIDLIKEERERQINEEGWTFAHDDEHNKEELSRAAACYAMPEDFRWEFTKKDEEGYNNIDDPWPWDKKWDKRGKSTRERDLVKAGALIVAEIERLRRKDDEELENKNWGVDTEELYNPTNLMFCLLEDLSKKMDVHRTIASIIYNKPIEDISKEERMEAKHALFGLLSLNPDEETENSKLIRNHFGAVSNFINHYFVEEKL